MGESSQRNAAKVDFSSLTVPPPPAPLQPQQPQLAPLLQQAPSQQPSQQQQQPQQQTQAKRRSTAAASASRGSTATKRSKRSGAAAQQQEQTVDGDGKPVDKRYLNKLAADKYRKKKRQQFEELSVKSQALEQQNHKLTAQCSKLESEVDYLKQLLMVTVQNSANKYADVDSQASHASSFDMEGFAKTYMEKHASAANARIQQLEDKLMTLSAQLAA